MYSIRMIFVKFSVCCVLATIIIKLNNLSKIYKIVAKTDFNIIYYLNQKSNFYLNKRLIKVLFRLIKAKFSDILILVCKL